MRQRTTRRERRAIEAADNVSTLPLRAAAVARHPSSQAPGDDVTRPVSSAVPRRGLVRRAKAYLARRYLDKLGPAVVPPLVAGAVTLVAVGIVVGLVLGVVLAASVPRRGMGEWTP